MQRFYSSWMFALPLLAVLLAVTAWLYWPGTSGPPLLDDVSSVLVIDDLQSQPERFWDVVFGDGSGPLGRPVSMLSFALEKLWLGDSLQISKRVNLALHLFNGVLVVSIFSLLLARIAGPAAPVLATLLAGAWLLAPLQVSSVLYVVQRMAMLSTTFILCALLAWVLWRQRLAAGQMAWHWLLLVLLAALAAIFAKENAVVIVPVLLLVEALWFQCRDAQGLLMPRWQRAVFGAIAAGAAGLLAVAALRWESLAGAFRHRPFSLEERLLTQLRVLWDYVGQLLWPDLQRLGVYHDDFGISRSLTDPLTTLWAAVAWGAVVVFAALALRWRQGRWAALCIAWFVVAHAVESTVLPLELYFEHRNYFPSLGLWLLLGLLLVACMRIGPPMVAPVLTLLGVYVFWLALQTSPLVQIWSSRPLLAMHHINGHPDSARANTDMAVLMAGAGAMTEARHYSQRAFASGGGERDADRALRDLALACIAGATIDPSEIERIGTADPQRPVSSVTTLLTLVRLLQDGACPGFPRERFADRMAILFLVEDFEHKAAANVYSSLAVLENALGRFDYALRYTEQFLALSPNNTRGQLMQLHFATALGKVEVVEQMIAALQAKQAAGELNVGEQQTLALYTEQP
ncbi:hypothetical protein Q6D67_06840 [Haliea sp. E1-2-M8]|uniref:hypothetical protein n=1 Tax=Haliea sp. E1-2-M8 TaxID=3064706 RepID=UPI0027281BB0|nr:hypothetical protein [Haliea sp. E1-2-M8]MDO8861413.1 hypothetical protein [Haliea sp. E1-2-M8]